MLNFTLAVLASLSLTDPHLTWDDTGPVAREHASVFQFGDDVIVYAGSGYEPQLQPLGDAWTFDTEAHTWTELSVEGDAPAPGGSKRVADTEAGMAYIFGGYGAQFACNNDLYKVERRENALVFTAIQQINPPPARALHAFVFDPDTNRFMVMQGVSPLGFLGDMWIGAFDEGGAVVWTEVSVHDSFEARFGFAYGFESTGGDLVLFSGQLAPTESEPMRMARDAWSVNFRGDEPLWNRIPIEASVTGRRNPCFAFDDEADRMLIWCGTADAQTNVPGLVWLTRMDASWIMSTADDDGYSPRRSSGFGFADPQSDAIVVGFGNSAEGRYTDWIYVDRRID